MTASQSFTHFMLRRVWCTTLSFVTLIAVLFMATSVYYVVRINTIEKHLNAQALKAAPAGKTEADDDFALLDDMDVLAHDGEAATHRRHQFMSRATPAGHSLIAGRQRRISKSFYNGLYKDLTVNSHLTRQAVRNPTLPDSIPLWEEAGAQGEENVKDGVQAVPRVSVPARQRYVLQGLEPGKQYMLRVSYLGSPSVTFEVLLYQVSQSRLSALRKGVGAAAGGGDVPQRPRHPGWSAVPQDTELRVFEMSATDALQFDYEEEVWFDALDDGGDDGEGDEDDDYDGMTDDNLKVEGLDTVKASTGRYAAVVEVRPRALSIPIDSTRLPVVYFNIVLEPLSSSFLPQVAIPLITYSVWVVMFVGYLCIYTVVSSGIAGGRPHED
ncbi:hypothetical protein ABL78_1539 [Leptomonas seymouri]|uniref:Transmembrane protein n=1 Tax=Leptomonas seymouri TaxID=5684 RepID=A0A0N1I0F8_LEPSE|nr:hypothetical protein ABL78_1539 [Leptomonas seymouri]|eukprot:KPI89310.1 hypothetical protein ABL78_1539 [Leptomonas seymouri]